MRTIDVKAEPLHFQKLKNGTRRFDFRVNDQNFAIGDLLCLREFKPQLGQYTGDALMMPITDIMAGTERPTDISYRCVIMSLGEPIKGADSYSLEKT